VTTQIDQDQLELVVYSVEAYHKEQLSKILFLKFQPQGSDLALGQVQHVGYQTGIPCILGKAHALRCLPQFWHRAYEGKREGGKEIHARFGD
jgi:hypothetical protein